MERGFIGLDIAVLAVSDAASIADEAPAQLVLERLGVSGHRIVARERIDDSVQLIRAKYLEWIADSQVDVVIVTSGAKSEAAGEALAPLITKQLAGFSDLFRYLSFSEIGTAAMLVDAAAAQCKSTFIFVLPASIGAVRTALDKLLLPQLDYRTKPQNLVMRMPRHNVGSAEADAPVARTPWIVPKDRNAPAAPTAPPVDAFTTKESTDVGVPPPPPIRAKVTTAKDNVPLKPPAQLVPLSQLLTNAPDAADASDVEELPAAELKDIAPAQIVDDESSADGGAPDYDAPAEPTPHEDLPIPASLSTRIPTGPIRIEDESTREAILAAQKRAVTERVTPIDELPPRSVAIPARRKRDNKVLAIWAVIVAAAASLVVMFFIARERDHRAQALRQQREAETRVADLSPPTPTPPEPEPSEPSEPKEIDMSADPSVVDPPATPTEPANPTRVAANPGRPTRPATTPQPRPPKEPAPPVEKPPVEKPDPQTPPVEAGCDEVSCVLDRYRLSCCTKYKPAEPAAPPVHSGLPDKLDRSMVTAGIAKVKPAVIACGEKSGTKGMVKIAVTVSPDGAVTEASVSSSPDEALGACVANAVRRATFDKTANGGSFGYPFVF